MTRGDAEKIAEQARAAKLTFPAHSIYVHHSEATGDPQVTLVATEPFEKAMLQRLVDFANRRGLRLRVGGDGTKFHSAAFLPKS